MDESRYLDLDFAGDSSRFTATLLSDVGGRKQLLLAGRPEDELLVYGSSLPAQPIPGPQTILHGGDLIRALAFELPIAFDQAYESNLEPLGPYWRLRRAAERGLPNVFDVVLTVDRPASLAAATASFGPVHRTQLEPIPEYVVTVDATELLQVLARVMGLGWTAE